MCTKLVCKSNEYFYISKTVFFVDTYRDFNVNKRPDPGSTGKLQFYF
jgi:hypothetical protein